MLVPEIGIEGSRSWSQCWLLAPAALAATRVLARRRGNVGIVDDDESISQIFSPGDHSTSDRIPRSIRQESIHALNRN